MPVIGCGTWIGFDQAPGHAEYQRLPGVLDALFDAGGKVIDSSPMYGRAEETTGELLAASGRRREAFLATKVWTCGRDDGIAQMEASMRLLRTDRIDLMQIHNLVDWRTQLATLRALEGRGPHPLPRHHALHGVGVRRGRGGAARRNSSTSCRSTTRSTSAKPSGRLLPLAAERGVAVIVNMPFGGGGLLRACCAKPLPPWAAEIGCTSWAQLLLKFVLSHPAVTCAIPGTRRREHMADNAARRLRRACRRRAFWRDKLDAIGR